jgi:hypothetical protein
VSDLRLSPPPLIFHTLGFHDLPHSLGPETLLVDVARSSFQLLQKLKLGSLREQPLLNSDVLRKVLHALLERDLELVVDKRGGRLLLLPTA